ncbi:MAG: 50S ribosome-binding GTPase, partial [Pseudomonadales bacterium]|nr:50S ribosome-binding GTPase [Pseudomonadales bacterium]
CLEKPWEQLAQDQYSENAASAWKLVPMTTTRITGQIALRHATGEIDRLLTQVRTLADEGELAAAAACLEPYLGTFALGEHVTKPFVVALAGRPNAGKSSLLNACAGFDRAIIHDQAGTTRDVLQHHTVLAGWPVTLLDTAGLRDGAAKLEQLGIDKAQQALQQADLVLWIHDATEPWEVGSDVVPAALAEMNHLLIVNKTDLQSPTDGLPNHIAVSAWTGSGTAELLDAVIEQLVPVAAVGADSPESGHQHVLLTQAMDDRFCQWHQALQAGQIPGF